MGRIGKRVKLPHGPATVMLSTLAGYRASDLIREGCRQQDATDVYEAKSGDLPEA